VSLGNISEWSLAVIITVNDLQTRLLLLTRAYTHPFPHVGILETSNGGRFVLLVQRDG
jgi:hypothetical protein